MRRRESVRRERGREEAVSRATVRTSCAARGLRSARAVRHAVGREMTGVQCRAERGTGGGGGGQRGEAWTQGQGCRRPYVCLCLRERVRVCGCVACVRAGQVRVHRFCWGWLSVCVSCACLKVRDDGSQGNEARCARRAYVHIDEASEVCAICACAAMCDLVCTVCSDSSAGENKQKIP